MTVNVHAHRQNARGRGESSPGTHDQGLPWSGQLVILLTAVTPSITNTRNKMRNTAARNFAIAKDAPAIVVKPSTAAITPITRNVKAQPSMVTSIRLNRLIRRNAFRA